MVTTQNHLKLEFTIGFEVELDVLDELVCKEKSNIDMLKIDCILISWLR
jgi:hypothetical protein